MKKIIAWAVCPCLSVISLALGLLLARSLFASYQADSLLMQARTLAPEAYWFAEGLDNTENHATLVE